MASSFSHQGAREAPPPDQLAAYSLTGKVVHAALLNRRARDAELPARAALKAEALHGGDSLVVAYLRMNLSKALMNLTVTTSGPEQDALYLRSWSALLLVIALLQGRLTANTLLPGTVRKEEPDYYAHVQAARLAAQNKAVPAAAAVIVASNIGYTVLVDALCRSLNYMTVSLHCLWPTEERKIVESFVRPLLSSLYPR